MSSSSPFITHTHQKGDSSRVVDIVAQSFPVIARMGRDSSRHLPPKLAQERHSPLSDTIVTSSETISSESSVDSNFWDECQSLL